MSTYFYGPALDSELDYRRSALMHDADVARLDARAGLVTRAARAARRLAAGHRTETVAAVTIPDSPAALSEHPAEHPAERAA